MLVEFFAANPDPMLCVASTGEVVDGNPASEVILRAWGIAVGGAVPARVHEAVQAALAASETHSVQVRVGIDTFELVLVPLEDRCNVYGHRYTEQEKMQQELVLARDMALEASRAKSTFLANMSHELRTPLNAIIGYSDLLIEDADELGGQVIGDLGRIRKSGQHLLQIINQILDLSKIEAGRSELSIEKVDLDKLIEDVRAEMEPVIQESGNELLLDTGGAPSHVRADYAKIRQILCNLLSNASKFTHRGGVSLEVVASGAQVSFTVTDTGIGITDEELDRVWSSFAQADESTARGYGGTGLGLTVAKRFCEMMGGSITAASHPGEGTSFIVVLPTTPIDLAPEQDH